MPFFEVTVITRSLSKADLVKALMRAGNTLLSNGAVIEKVESLGHRDLPIKRLAKQTSEPVYSSNYFLFHAHIPLDKRKNVMTLLKHDLDNVHVETVAKSTEPAPTINCNLEELLKPPAERESVKQLREGQKMGHFTRQIIFKRTEKEWRSVPKSYPIAPPRD